MKWSKIPPIAPKSPPSLYYWYWDNGDIEPCVMELWAKRDVKRFAGDWWLEPVPCPPCKPPGR